MLREKQLNNEFKPLLELISDSFFRSVGQPLDNATIPKKDPLFEALYSHTNVQGRQYHREGAVEVLASDVSGPSNNSNVEASGYTPGAKKIKKRNDGNREQHKNKEERDRNGENDNDKEERDGIDAVGKLHERIQKYLIICLPHFNGHRMEHLEISRQVADDKLVKVVKKKYHTQRTIWKRLKSLRGFSTIRLARVGPNLVLRPSKLLIENSSNLPILERGYFPLRLNGAGRRLEIQIGNASASPKIHCL